MLRLTYYLAVGRRRVSSFADAPRGRSRLLGAIGTGPLAGAGTTVTLGDTPTPIQVSTLIVVVILSAALAWHAQLGGSPNKKFFY